MTWIVTPNLPHSGASRSPTVDGHFLTYSVLSACENPAELLVSVDDAKGARIDVPAAEFFRFQRRDKIEGRVILDGDFSHVRKIASAGPKKMNSGDVGRIDVHGIVGPLCGHRMRRGIVVIQGDAGDWLGGMMIAGTIVITGELGKGTMMGAKRGLLIHRKQIEMNERRFTIPQRTTFPFASFLSQLDFPMAMKKSLLHAKKNPPHIRRGDLSVEGLAETVELDDE